MITTQSLEQLKNNIDIVDITSSYIELKKSGGNFKACCPFHGEKTPSLVISPTKQIYHCFGCGVGGDAIKFVQDYEKLTFFEAVEKIAELSNFTLEYQDDNQSKSKSAYETLEIINRFYQRNLKLEHREYLYQRGLSDATISEWEIGYAGASKEQIQYITSNFLSIESGIEAGILADDGEKKYSRFTHRVMFPIKTPTGKVCGFSGRILEGDRAKYLNSPATKVFDKSRLFFGLDKAKEHIYKKGTIVIVEGNIDVPLLHQIGIKTAVATLGTALTSHHIVAIKKLGARVLLAYDGDKAGFDAGYKASVLLSTAGIDGGIVFFDDGDDPASMIQSKRDDELVAKLKKPLGIIKFVLQTISSKYDLKNPYDKSRSIKEIQEYLRGMDNLIVANEYVGYASKLIDVNPSQMQLGQTKAQEMNYKSKLSMAEMMLYKTMLEIRDFEDIAMANVDIEALMDTEVGKAIAEENYTHPSIYELQVRDDIAIYDAESFKKACKLKQKSHLKRKLQELSQTNSLTPEVFEMMAKLGQKIKYLQH